MAKRHVQTLRPALNLQFLLLLIACGAIMVVSSRWQHATRRTQGFPLGKYSLAPAAHSHACVQVGFWAFHAGETSHTAISIHARPAADTTTTTTQHNNTSFASKQTSSADELQQTLKAMQAQLAALQSSLPGAIQQELWLHYNQTKQRQAPPPSQSQQPQQQPQQLAHEGVVVSSLPATCFDTASSCVSTPYVALLCPFTCGWQTHCSRCKAAATMFFCCVAASPVPCWGRASCHGTKFTT